MAAATGRGQEQQVADSGKTGHPAATAEHDSIAARGESVKRSESNTLEDVMGWMWVVGEVSLAFTTTTVLFCDEARRSL